jgi:hypothetical protein
MEQKAVRNEFLWPKNASFWPKNKERFSIAPTTMTIGAMRKQH